MTTKTIALIFGTIEHKNCRLLQQQSVCHEYIDQQIVYLPKQMLIENVSCEGQVNLTN